MWTCIKCGEKHEDTFDDCWNCGTSRDGTENPAFRRADDVGSAEAGRLPLVLDPAADVAALPTDGDTGILRKMALSTTPVIPGCRLERTLGVVCGEAVIASKVLDGMIATRWTWPAAACRTSRTVWSRHGEPLWSCWPNGPSPRCERRGRHQT